MDECDYPHGGESSYFIGPAFTSMVNAFLLSGITPIDGSGYLSDCSFLTNPFSLCWFHSRSCRGSNDHRQRYRRRLWGSVTTSASANVNGKNHYAVLGVASDSSLSDIKKAYRLLALKYHPDVVKDPGADGIFKSIRLAYDVLSNDTTRNQYDQSLGFQDSHTPLSDTWEDELRIYKWPYIRQKVQQREKHWQHEYQSRYGEDDETCDDDETYDDDVSDEEEEERGSSFYEVVKSAFLSLFVMQVVGIRLSLTLSSLTALMDRKLDSGYKIGYLIAWILGGPGGVLLTLLLSFASWLCGKTSSGLVALIVVAMWCGSNVASFTLLPQGALLTLVYMSIKLQVDLK